MMNAVVVPPFERFYLDHRDAIFAFLTRRLGRQAAEDAFQETFLRALAGYPRLRHADDLRAWVFTIAARIVTDEHRRRKPSLGGPMEQATEVRRPAYAELDHFAGALPPTERAAVVLRYGYDLTYADIGMALGSSEAAARQAASSGVRRLRRKGLQHDLPDLPDLPGVD
jgi:RNA polymerase sigma-70 factor (ECF subfamily)